MTERSVCIEVLIADSPEDAPAVEADSRVDVSVNGQMYPTAKLVDGRYVAWWFETAAPAPDSSVTTEWVAAPTRYLAAATLDELWENPASFDTLTEA
ncbi:hypothetical protein ACFFQF_25405 [Haladaptatus pallidirubidus]|uniref:Uncharacterized protein n=1 Tax=Haladaptatus pallidirubidus TaxID=1008152 RepID=A0AAV3UGH4_9EURY|nr:hypothetical protein [Haladaptatus pallidirubidus]